MGVEIRLIRDCRLRDLCFLIATGRLAPKPMVFTGSKELDLLNNTNPAKVQEMLDLFEVGIK